MSETLIGNVRGLQGERGPQGAAGETGATGPQGPTGPAGQQGTPGVGVPTGGTTGQVLKKVDGTDYNTEWGDAGGGAITVNATPIVINVEQNIQTQLNTVPDNTIGTLRFVDSNQEDTTATIYRSLSVAYQRNYDSEFNEEMPTEYAYVWRNQSGLNYAKINGMLYAGQSGAGYPLFGRMVSGTPKFVIDNLAPASQVFDLKGAAIMGENDATRMSKTSKCLLAYTEGVGIEIVPYVQPDASVANVVNSLPALDQSNASVSTNTVTATMSNGSSFIARNGVYIAHITTNDGYNDLAKVTIAVKPTTVVREYTITVKVEPMGIYDTVDFTTKQWHLDIPSRLGNTVTFMHAQ